MVWVAGIGIFILLLFFFPKKMGILCSGIFIIFAAILGYFYLEKIQVKRDLRNLLLEVEFTPKCSSPEYPISLKLSNETGRRIYSMTFELKARKPEHSSTVYSSSYTDDHIFEPDKDYFSCLSLDIYGWKKSFGSNDVKSLEWAARPSSVQFEDPFLKDVPSNLKASPPSWIVWLEELFFPSKQ